MTKQYKVTRAVSLQNALVSILVRLGIVPRWHLVAVEGRVSGKLRETPIDPITVDGKRYFVAPFGEVNWVQNARKASRVKLTRGRKAEFLEVREASPAESAPVLRAYLRRGYSEDYFAAGPESPIAEFEAESAVHPVFLIADPVPPSQ